MSGSHSRSELHVFHTADRPPTETRESGGVVMSLKKICKICQDEIEVKENGEVFVACGECGFPVCRPCYAYERSEGNQSCPQCHTRYKRHKGCPRVASDDEDDSHDDFELEFQIKNHHASPNHHHSGSIPYQTVLNEEGREDLLKY
ncbi:hypothetical protein K7X08_016366 [Anisodus acutangulus]|uniref:RING-type domain-containing protein n=1 Tax=Anisodus acutangulus TaxID=402998 RepID=A0A9Q1LF18_9SOLA|nr:hypothetical protein K7X08_016366 [Anisodus acutangulus]